MVPSIHVASKAFAQHVESTLEAKATDYNQLSRALDEFARRQAARKITDIAHGLRKLIRSIIDEGLQNDISPDDVAAQIEEAIIEDLGPARAARIARTEAHAAAEFGKFAAAQASGLPYEKEWLSTEDERVRADHAAAHGQRVPLEDAFFVGGEALLYPGDPQGSAKQVINCRCVAHYHKLKPTRIPRKPKIGPIPRKLPGPIPRKLPGPISRKPKPLPGPIPRKPKLGPIPKR